MLRERYGRESLQLLSEAKLTALHIYIYFKSEWRAPGGRTFGRTNMSHRFDHDYGHFARPSIQADLQLTVDLGIAVFHGRGAVRPN